MYVYVYIYIYIYIYIGTGERQDRPLRSGRGAQLTGRCCTVLAAVPTRALAREASVSFTLVRREIRRGRTRRPPPHVRLGAARIGSHMHLLLSFWLLAGTPRARDPCRGCTRDSPFATVALLIS